MQVAYKNIKKYKIQAIIKMNFQIKTQIKTQSSVVSEIRIHL